MLTMLIWSCAGSVYLSVIFHKGDFSIGGSEGASRVLFPLYIINTVCLVVVPEGRGEEGRRERERQEGRKEGRGRKEEGRKEGGRRKGV